MDWLQGSRRDILRYGSLGISLSCLVFAFSNRKVRNFIIFYIYTPCCIFGTNVALILSVMHNARDKAGNAICFS